MASHTVIYPGSFDPPTNGHISLIHRALRMFEQVIVTVAHNPKKSPLFTLEERRDLLLEAMGHDPRVEVDFFEGLLVDYARRRGVKVVMRGLRAVSDFEYEFQMAVQNRHLAPEVDTLYMMTEAQHFYVSSRMAKEIAMLNGDVSHMVPELVVQRMRDKRRTP